MHIPSILSLRPLPYRSLLPTVLGYSESFHHVRCYYHPYSIDPLGRAGTPSFHCSSIPSHLSSSKMTDIQYGPTLFLGSIPSDLSPQTVIETLSKYGSFSSTMHQQVPQDQRFLPNPFYDGMTYSSEFHFIGLCTFGSS